MASCRRRQPQAVQHPFRRRHRQIVQKLMEETSLAEEDNNRRERLTVSTSSTEETAISSGTPSGVTMVEPVAHDKDIRRDHESGAAFKRVLNCSSFKTIKKKTKE